MSHIYNVYHIHFIVVIHAYLCIFIYIYVYVQGYAQQRLHIGHHLHLRPRAPTISRETPQVCFMNESCNHEWGMPYSNESSYV